MTSPGKTKRHPVSVQQGQEIDGLAYVAVDRRDPDAESCREAGVGVTAAQMREDKERLPATGEAAPAGADLTLVLRQETGKLQRTNTAGLTALPTKTQSSERRIALPTPCLRSLDQHRNRQRQEREAAGAGWQDSGYVFTRPNGAPIEGATLTRHFNTLLHRARLRHIRFHDLRHSAATLLLEQGVELVVIKELLGHAHIGVTATVYAHVRLRLQRDAIDLLGCALRSPTENTGEPDDGDEPPPCAAAVR